ncbi:MAG: metallopeptidase TldD-related protein [Acidobacteriota bacterium]
MLTEREAQEIVEKALAAVKADAARVNVWHGRSATTRFANNAITQNVDTQDQGISVEVSFGPKSGSASGNAFDAGSIASVVRRAEENARVAPPDPEYLPPLPKVAFPPYDPWNEATAALSAEDRARKVVQVVERARKATLSAAGIVENGSSASAVGNSAGLFAFQRGTSYAFSTTMTASDSSGWVSRAGRDIADADIDALAARAVERARAAGSPKDWPAGKYPTILEPACLSSIVGLLGWGISQREIDAGRSFLSGKRDAKLFDEKIVLRSDPFHARMDGSRWFGEGFPQKPIVWVEDGKFQNVYYDRFTAKKHSVDPTPWASNLLLEIKGSGADTVDKMIASIERGILVTHFWYIRAVDPMKPLFTGMTRDGLLAIENGKVAGGLKSFRWNENPIDVLNAIEMSSAPEPANDVEAETAMVPAVKVKEFNFTSGTLF